MFQLSLPLPKTLRARRGIVVITICSIDRTKLTWSENGRFPKIGSPCFKSLAELGRTGSVRPSIGLSFRSIIDTLKDDVTLAPQKDLYKKKLSSENTPLIVENISLDSIFLLSLIPIWN